MKILFVAMTQSIHTTRWINQIIDEAWEVHLFPSWDLTIHPQLRNLTIHGFKVVPDNVQASIQVDENSLINKSSHFVDRILNHRFLRRVLQSNRLRKIGFGSFFDWIGKLQQDRPVLPYYVSDEERCAELIKAIKRIKPDIVHSLEIQHAGYLTLAAKKKMDGNFPTWIVTNWGADIHHFGEIPEHAKKIRETLESCDYYACECQRDVKLAYDFGFKGQVLPVLTNTGGFDFDFVDQFRLPGSSSQRKVIALKGYQGWVYRALVGIEAIEMCADIILEKGYKVVIYLASPGVPEAAEKLQKKTGIPIEIMPYTSHENMLKLHGRARVSMGLSMSDAISTSFLEAMVMGSFPIQSCTSCANEWVKSGQTAFLVPPEDAYEVAHALRIALVDDNLIDHAADINGQMLRDKLDHRKVQESVISTYRKI